MEHISELNFKVDNGVGTLTLNRPEKRNALTTSMYEGLREILVQAKRRDDIKVILVTGQGVGFCAGSDAETRLLPRIMDDNCVPLEKTRAELLEPVMLYLAPALYDLGKPSIAAINGVAAGAGLSLALLCDIRIASDNARFATSWINIGLTPDCGASFLLPRIIGVDKALKLCYTGEAIDAHEAEQMGLVTQVVVHDNLKKSALELAQKIASKPSTAIELTKRALYRGLTNDMVSQLYFENYTQNICFMSEDFKEGIRAFQKKR